MASGEVVGAFGGKVPEASLPLFKAVLKEVAMLVVGVGG